MKLVRTNSLFRNFSTMNPDLASPYSDLLDNVLLVKKTPKYDRLKDTALIKHPYI